MARNLDATRLDALIDEAVLALQHLYDLEAKGRLSASAFAEMARVNAGISASTLAKLAARIEGRAELGVVQSFIKRLVREFSQAGWTSPPPPAKYGRCVRAYGHETVPGVLAEHDLKIGHCVAYAAKLAAERNPEAFGRVEDMAAHLDQQAKLRDELEDLYGRMRKSWGGQDIEVAPQTATDRENNTLHVSFRRSPDVNPSMSDWPAALTRRCLERKRAAAELRAREKDEAAAWATAQRRRQKAVKAKVKGKSEKVHEPLQSLADQLEFEKPRKKQDRQNPVSVLMGAASRGW